MRAASTHSRNPAPVEPLVKAFEEFSEAEASSGLLLLGAALVALVAANSPWASAWEHFWEIELSIRLGSLEATDTLHHWIGDGLMAVFFFVVGLEIKREVLVGELASFRKAALPVLAALGGMVVPALLYLGFNHGRESSSGWGIPMATDIAFTLGLLGLLGERVPLALKVFLAAVAIADDLGAVLVIALFYAGQISAPALICAGALLAVALLANLLGVRRSWVYALLGVAVWLAFLKSGIHATVAGVLMALTIPARARLNSEEFVATSRGLLDEYEHHSAHGQHVLTNEEGQDALHALETACEHVHTPLQHLEHTLHPWVTFVIMPLFALANAGVHLSGSVGELWRHPVPVGIFLGLVLGKPLGILLFTWIAVKLGVAALPAGVSWRQVSGLGCLAGIGFTMSLFIADLALDGAQLLVLAKVGVLGGSLLAGVAGFLLLRHAPDTGQNSPP